MTPNFKQNKYLDWYYNLVAKGLARKGFEVYGEWHHIIPRSLGGTNEPSNLVRLTAREHYIAHRLLTKFTSGKERAKMESAYRFMFIRTGAKLPSREVARIRELNATLMRTVNIGRVRSPETRKKIGDAHRGKIVSAEIGEKIAANNRLRKHSQEAKEKISQASRGDKNGMFGRSHSDGAKEAVSRANKGKSPPNKGVPMSDEQKALLSAARKGKPASNKGLRTPVHSCPGCGRMATKSALARYHKTC